jgi:hypothetical protein
MPDRQPVSNLQLVLVSSDKMVVYRRIPANTTLSERVRATVVAYRTFSSSDGIYTDVLVEDTAGMQEFVPLSRVTFLKRAAELPTPPPKAPAGGF